MNSVICASCWDFCIRILLRCTDPCILNLLGLYPENHSLTCVISGFLGALNVNCVLLGCYAASNVNFLPMFRDNLSVPSSRVAPILKGSMKMGPTGCPATSVRNYHFSLRNNPEERSFHNLTPQTYLSRIPYFQAIV